MNVLMPKVKKKYNYYMPAGSKTNLGGLFSLGFVI